jgi:tetratricopeptide (TPR) repeat protein
VAQKPICVRVVLVAASCATAALLLAAAGGRPALAASADDARTENARAHYLQGDAYYKLDKYANALQEYEQAYIAKADPSFLYNIAQCHRLMGNRAEALKFYKRYLKDAPNAPNRPVAEKHIKDLEASLAHVPDAPNAPTAPQTGHPGGAAAAATAVVPPPVSPITTPSPTSAPTAVSAMPAPQPVQPLATGAVALDAPPPGGNGASSANVLVGENGSPRSQDEHHPIYTKWWFWTAIGAVVVGGVLIALTAGHDPSCPSGRTCR